MKKTIKPAFLFASLFLIFFTAANTLKAQTSPAPQLTYKEMVVENPNAEADMQVVSNYVNALISGDINKAKSLMADTYKGYGPAPTDSSTGEQTISGWQENYKRQLNRKVSFVTQTFKVTSGNLQGDWVSMWGDYSFNENGKDIKFPFQYTAHVTNGKIDSDRIYYDRLYIMQTLGYTVTPPAGSK